MNWERWLENVRILTTWHEAYVKFERNINDKIFIYVDTILILFCNGEQFEIAFYTLVVLLLTSSLPHRSASFSLALVSVHSFLFAGAWAYAYAIGSLHPIRYSRVVGTIHFYIFYLVCLCKPKLYVTLIGRICVMCSCVEFSHHPGNIDPIASALLLFCLHFFFSLPCFLSLSVPQSYPLLLFRWLCTILTCLFWSHLPWFFSSRRGRLALRLLPGSNMK